MSCDIDYAEVNKLHNSYKAYNDELSGGGASGAAALCRIDSACYGLSCMESFQGPAAQAIKSYFVETHCKLSRAVATLARQLAMDYAGSFQTRFAEGTVSESHSDARWPSDAMEDAATKIVQFQTKDLQDAYRHVTNAVNMLPPGSSFTISFPSALSDALHNEFSLTSKVKNAVEEIDAAGKTALSNSEGEFESLAQSLSAAIAACATISGRASGSYQSGAFNVIADSSGLSKALQDSCAIQAEKHDMIVASYQQSLEVERSNNEIAAKKALEQKKTAAWFGIGGTALIIVGAVATVATMGAAAPIVVALTITSSAITATGAALDMRSRIEQLGELYWGDPLADKKEVDEAGVSKTLAGAAKTTKGYYSAYYDSTRGNAGKLPGDVSGMVNRGGDKILDEVVDLYERESGLTGTKEGAILDAAWEGVKEAKGQVLKGEFSASGVIGTVGKMTTGVADYYVEEADNKLEALAERSSKLDSVEDNLTQEEYVWSSD